MIGAETAIIAFLALPAAIASTAKLLELFCEIRTGSVSALGACLGGAIAFQPAVCVRIVDALGRLQSSEAAVLFFSARLFLLGSLIFCTAALSVLSIELPARWLLARGHLQETFPWQFIRMLCITVILSGAGTWMLDLLGHAV